MTETDQPTDPQHESMRLRALAHPLRWKLIDLVAQEGSVTATRCAEVLGESVASCWYHLGILGKYGYLEAVPGTSGREKPWRATAALGKDLSGRTDDAETQAAGLAAASAFIDHEAARAKERIRRLETEPEQWRATNALGSVSVFVTVEELAEVKAELLKILHRYADRTADVASRPTGSRAARIFVSSGVEPTD